jgi:putative flippase GtrA
MVKRELGLFLIVGMAAVLIDYWVYELLVWTHWLTVEFAKGLGFITGTIFAYLANRLLTFGKIKYASRKSLWRFVILYSFTLWANVEVNSLALNSVPVQSWANQIAFISATAVSAALNFVGMKFYVFKAPTPLKST